MKKDNIEDLYGELKTYSKEPPKELWENIEARLHPKKKRRGIIWFWGSVAAILILFVGYMFMNSSNYNSSINKIVDTEHLTDDTIKKPEEETTKIVENDFENNIKNDSLAEEPNITKNKSNNITNQSQLYRNNELVNNKKQQNPVTQSSNNKIIYDKEENPNPNNSYAQNIEKKKNNEFIKKDVLETEQINNENIANDEKEKGIASNDSISQVKETRPLDLIEQLIAKSDVVSDSINTNVLAGSKWSIEVLGGLSNTASKSTIQGTSVNASAQNNFVYVLKVGYALSDRLVFKSGIGKNILGQEVNNILYTSSDTSLSADNSLSIINNEAITILASQESILDASVSEETINEGTLQQQLDYIQVPLEISYNVISKQNYHVALGIGGNVNFLTSNKSFLDNEQIGESLGVNTTIYGATINSNLSYKLDKKVILFIEPSYNYFEKPINNNNQKFNNTQLRVLFGLQFKL